MVLKSSVAAVAARGLLASNVNCSETPSAQNFSNVNNQWRLPQNAWETHVHVFDPIKYPYAVERLYTPETATFESLLAFNSNISTTRTPQNIVFVQPSPYGTDNSFIVDLLREHAKNSSTSSAKLRAITVFDEEKITDEQLSDWNSIGVRGFRVNVESSSTGIDYDALNEIMNKTAHRVKQFDWKCQLYIASKTWDHINETIHDLPIAVIADHQGGMKGLSSLPANTTSVTSQPGFAALMSLAKAGKVFIKISAFYRSSTSSTPGYDDLEPLIKVFAEEVPQQLIWGSDWPHTESANRTEENKYIPRNFRDVDNEAVLRNLRKWVGDGVWQSMMVDTPARIYT